MRLNLISMQTDEKVKALMMNLHQSLAAKVFSSVQSVLDLVTLAGLLSQMHSAWPSLRGYIYLYLYVSWFIKRHKVVASEAPFLPERWPKQKPSPVLIVV